MSKVAPKFPAVDAHTHIEANGVEVAVDTMDSAGLTHMVNLTAGNVLDFEKGKVFTEGKHADRFAACVTLNFDDLDDKDWGKRQADGLEAAVKAGFSALKEVKRLGLEIRWKNGKLLALDDPILNPVWERCAKLGVPVIIHTTDPVAFHKPLGLSNERLTELQAHPDWVFLKPGLPTKQELFEARSRVIAENPQTTFICVHVANYPEDPVTVGRWLEEHPNMNIDLAARFVEIGRHHPEMMRNFFVRYQDRILFGTDSGISADHFMLGVSMPSDSEFFKRENFKEEFLFPYHERMYRYLETDDYYIPPSTPIQGSWVMHGIGLGDDVLKKIYYENAKRLIPGLA